jgi:hypothetical protein
MKFIPILFSTEMVQAILDGRKTMTRRVIKTPNTFKPWNANINDAYDSIQSDDKGEVSFLVAGDQGWTDWSKCPYGKVGDVLWVRESWMILDTEVCDSEIFDKDGFPTDEYQIQVSYKDGIRKWCKVSEEFYDRMNEKIDFFEQEGERWSPSIHMPKSACRIFLKITNIRVERLQDITDKDAISEGIQEFTKDNTVLKYGLDGWNWSEMPRKAKDGFLKLWESINGKESLNSNTWVWVIEFEKIDKPENFI